MIDTCSFCGKNQSEVAKLVVNGPGQGCEHRFKSLRPGLLHNLGGPYGMHLHTGRTDFVWIRGLRRVRREHHESQHGGDNDEDGSVLLSTRRTVAAARD